MCKEQGSRPDCTFIVAYCSNIGHILLSFTINSGFLCAKSKVPDRTVHSLLHTAHILVIFCCLLLLIQVFYVQRARFLTGLYIHRCILLHSNILVIFCCLLLLIQVFCVQRARFLTGLYILRHKLFIVIYWSYFVVCYY